MTSGSKARAKAALLLSVFLFGCENRASKAAQDVEARDASRQFYRTIVAAMCAPWSEHRGKILADLADVVRDEATSSPDSDPSQEVYEIAAHVKSKDCVRAGFSDPGEKFVDPKSDRRRQQFRQFLQSHPELAKP